MKHHDPDADGRDVSDEEANAIADSEEDLPSDAPPTQGLPRLTKLDPDEEKTDDGDGMEKALEILDEYEEGVPKRNPHVSQYEE